MKAIQNSVKWIVFSNLWIAFGASLFCAAVQARIALEIDWKTTLFVFGATLFAYNFQRLSRLGKEIEKNDSERIIWIKQHRILVWIVCGIGALVALSYAFYLSLNQLLFLVIPGLISVLYAFGKFSLRNIPFLKIIWISSVWASCIFLPFVDSEYFNQALIFSILTFVYIMALCIPFDIRDLKYDDSNKKTIPQLLGVKGAKAIASILLFACIILLQVFDKVNWFDVVSILFGLLLILFAKQSCKELYFSGLIDGHLVLYGLGLILYYGC